MVPYRFDRRLNEGLVRLEHPTFGVNLWHTAKVRKNDKACTDCKNVIERGASGWRPITFGYNRMHRLCNDCILLKEAGEKRIVCFNCGADCTSDDFCFGCKTYTCDDCGIGSPMGFGHSPEEHLKYEDE